MPMSNIHIRAAKAEDIVTIHDLGSSVSEFSVNEQTINFWPVIQLLHAIESKDVIVLIAEGDSLVGFVIANYSFGLQKALIENIYVAPEARGQHVGDMLLERLLEMLAQQGCKYIATLVPFDAEQAIGLYEKHGFTQGESFLWLDKSLEESFKK